MVWLTSSVLNVRLQAVWFVPLLRLFGRGGSGSGGSSLIGFGSNLGRAICTAKAGRDTKQEVKHRLYL